MDVCVRKPQRIMLRRGFLFGLIELDQNDTEDTHEQLLGGFFIKF